MKQALSIILTLTLLLALAACATADRPLTATELLELGEKYLLEQSYAQALVQFTKLIEIEPMNPRGYTGAAEAYVGLGQPDKAEAVLRQGLEVLPDNAELAAMLNKTTETITPEPEAPLESEQAARTENTPYVPALELSAEQQTLLLPLEQALLAYDVEAAFPAISHPELIHMNNELMTQIPLDSNGGYYELVYKTDENGTWMLIFSTGDDTAVRLHLLTDTQNGQRFEVVGMPMNEAEDERTYFVQMVTIDIADGTYNWLILEEWRNETIHILRG